MTIFINLLLSLIFKTITIDYFIGILVTNNSTMFYSFIKYK